VQVLASAVSVRVFSAVRSYMRDGSRTVRDGSRTVRDGSKTDNKETHDD
jgi:hypothetical protein